MNRVKAILGMSAAILVTLTSYAAAQDCHKPGALGTTRTLSINPAAYPLVGKTQYQETLPLNSREVVLSFDDGPSAPYTEMILDALAAECVKATFFVTGENVADDPELVRRISKEGHTIGTQAYNYASLVEMPFEEAKKQIDRGSKAVRDALQNPRIAAPFFRAPMLDLTLALQKLLLARGFMIWSIDVDSLDWAEPTEEQLVENTIKKLEQVGKGIVLLHDAQPVTARALPTLLAQLKLHNFRIVHMVPIDPER